MAFFFGGDKKRVAEMIAAARTGDTEKVEQLLSKGVDINAPEPDSGDTHYLLPSTRIKLKVWLDQGFGYWSSPRPGTRAAQTTTTWFNFSETSAWQGEEVGEGRYAVEGQSFSTYVFFERV